MPGGAAAAGSLTTAGGEAPAAGAQSGSAATKGTLIFRDATGRELTTADLSHVTGRVNYSVIGGENVPEDAQRWFREGQQAGGAADYKKALEMFARAQAAAPRWPYPVYETAYTYELMDQTDKALASYEAVLKLAPRGFFTALTSADCLRREAAHEWAPGTCKQYLMVEWLDERAKLKALQALTAKAPSLAQAWKALGIATEDDAGKLKAFETGLSHHPDPETRGMILINQALVLDRTGKRKQATEMLGTLALDPTAPLDVVEIAKMSLSQIMTPH